MLELEADDAVQQTVEALVDLSRDSLDMISLALTEQLERLAKVRFSFYAWCFRLKLGDRSTDGEGSRR